MLENLDQAEEKTTDDKRTFCQSVLLVIEQRRALDVLTWDTSTTKREWLGFKIKVLTELLEKLNSGTKQDSVSEEDRENNCPNANSEGRVTIRGMVEECGSYDPISNDFLWCNDWRTIGDHRRLAQLKAARAPRDVWDPVRRAAYADLECYKQARANGVSGWMPAYECLAADKLRPKAEASYKAYVASHPLPWKTQHEECAALRSLFGPRAQFGLSRMGAN